MNKYLNIDLQLFADDGDTEGFVDPELDETEDFDEAEETEEPETDEPEIDEDPEVVEPEQEQTPEQNAIYKRMRLKAKQEAEAELEAEKQRIAQERDEIYRLRQEREADEAERRVYSSHITPENIENKAYELNVTEDVARKLLEHEVSSIVQAEKNKVMQRFELIQKQKNDLKGDEYFPLIEKEVDKIVSTTPGIDFQTAYHYTVGVKRKELEKQVVSKAVKSTIANVQDRARRKGVTSSDAGKDEYVNPSSVLDKDSLNMTNAFGTDPRKIAKYVRDNQKKKGR